MVPRIYLAGPEVFLRDPHALYAAKREICRRAGFEGVSPLDSPLDLNQPTRADAGWLVSRTNEAHMRSCDLVIANITPFRSPSADVGTAFEMGFMRAIGKPVLAYSNVPGLLWQRTADWLGGRVSPRASGDGCEDPDGLLIEQFEMVDNLMLDGAVRSSHGEVIVVATRWEDRFVDLRGFEACVLQAEALAEKRLLGTSG